MKKINNKERQGQYQEKYQRDFSYEWFRYCKDPLEAIEGWDVMINDKSGQRWHLHHRDEIQSNGVVVSMDELKGRGEYYNLPASKLVFLTHSEHVYIHKLGKLNPMYGRTGDQNPMYGKTGELNPNYGHNKYGITEEDLYELYVIKGLTQREIGDKIGCYQTLVRYYLKKFGISRK